jgi:hypothetical protein
MQEQERLEKAIREIIVSIPSGLYFDSHTVIFMLLQQYSDEYLCGVRHYNTTETYHSEISKNVGSNGDLVEDTGTDAYSKNIHDKFTECRLWKRVSNG